MAISSSSSVKASPSPRHRAMIEEVNEDDKISISSTPISEIIYNKKSPYSHYKHQSTPLHHSDKTRSKGSSSAKHDKSVAVSCIKCRPSSREKISIVPMVSPNRIFKSIFKKSPKPMPSDDIAPARDEHWKILVTELSNNLLQATRKRDESILEASKLKHSMSELEKKLNKLEIYCDNLKSGLEVCNNVGNNSKVNHQDKVIEHFLITVSESRSTVKILSKAIVLQMRQMGPKVCDRVSRLVEPYDSKISSFSGNPRALVLYMEALLSKAFYADFEVEKSPTNTILNPIDRCEANFAMFSRLRGLNWEDVLNKGTKHFSEDFSKFCDRKMSEIVAMFGWDRAWPEPLLQAFFGASKSVWLVHLLANSVHPSLPIFRVDKGVRFDPVYMEDMGGDKVKMLVPTLVRIMVAPGFYVFDNVVKCKVISRYYNNVDR